MVSSLRKQKKKLKQSVQSTPKESFKVRSRKRKLKSERLEYIALVKEFKWLDELCDILEIEND